MMVAVAVVLQQLAMVSSISNGEKTKQAMMAKEGSRQQVKSRRQKPVSSEEGSSE